MTLFASPATALRRERLRAGLSQVALAVRAGCALSTVSLAERGVPLSPRMARRLAAALDVLPEVISDSPAAMKRERATRADLRTHAA